MMRVQLGANKRKREPALEGAAGRFVLAVKFAYWVGGEVDSSVEYSTVDATPNVDCTKGDEDTVGA